MQIASNLVKADPDGVLGLSLDGVLGLSLDGGDPMPPRHSPIMCRVTLRST